jgi:hypothetical protein
MGVLQICLLTIIALTWIYFHPREDSICTIAVWTLSLDGTAEMMFVVSELSSR